MVECQNQHSRDVDLALNYARGESVDIGLLTQSPCPSAVKISENAVTTTYAPDLSLEAINLRTFGCREIAQRCRLPLFIRFWTLPKKTHYILL